VDVSEDVNQSGEQLKNVPSQDNTDIPSKYDWRPLWRGVLAALELMERMSKRVEDDGNLMEAHATEAQGEQHSQHEHALAPPGTAGFETNGHTNRQGSDAGPAPVAAAPPGSGNDGSQAGFEDDGVGRLEKEDNIGNLGLQGVELHWLFNLVRFLLQVLAKLERWRELVWMGQRFIDAATGTY
jgi:hypothetical protein